MGMTVSISCDRDGCLEVDPDGSATGWYEVRRDGDRSVWLCCRSCLQRWAASL